MDFIKCEFCGRDRKHHKSYVIEDWMGHKNRDVHKEAYTEDCVCKEFLASIGKPKPMTILEAIEDMENGRIVYNSLNNSQLFKKDGDNYYVFYSGGFTLITDKSFTVSAIKADWFLMMDQKPIEWTPKKFDPILIRDFDDQLWSHRIFSKYIKQHLGFYTIGDDNNAYHQGIPLNEDTLYLLGTTDEPKVKYVIKEQKDEKD